MFEDEALSPMKLSKTSLTAQRRHSKSPYKPRADDGNAFSLTSCTNIHRDVSPHSPRTCSDIRKHIGPNSKSRRRRAPMRKNHALDNNEILSLIESVTSQNLRCKRRARRESKRRRGECGSLEIRVWSGYDTHDS